MSSIAKIIPHTSIILEVIINQRESGIMNNVDLVSLIASIHSTLMVTRNVLRHRTWTDRRSLVASFISQIPFFVGIHTLIDKGSLLRDNITLGTISPFPSCYPGYKVSTGQLTREAYAMITPPDTFKECLQ